MFFTFAVEIKNKTNKLEKQLNDFSIMQKSFGTMAK